MALTTTSCVELDDTVKANAQAVSEKADFKVADSMLMNSCGNDIFQITEATHSYYFSTRIRDPHCLPSQMNCCNIGCNVAPNAIDVASQHPDEAVHPRPDRTQTARSVGCGHVVYRVHDSCIG